MLAQAGIQKQLPFLGSRLRGNDESEVLPAFRRGERCKILYALS